MKNPITAGGTRIPFRGCSNFMNNCSQRYRIRYPKPIDARRVNQDEGALYNPDEKECDEALRCDPCARWKMVRDVRPFMSKSEGNMLRWIIN
jgi:hypothetical protein